MPLTKCVRCKKLFNKMENPVCGDCMPAEQDDFETIRKYVAENEGADALVVSKATGVDINCVNRMIENGNIATLSADLDASSFTCGQCGAPAISSTKRLCQDCLDKLNLKMMATRKDMEVEQQNNRLKGSSVHEVLNSKRNR